MSVSSAIAIYFVLWWIVLFAVLPFGVRSQIEDGEAPPGTDPGAPVMPLMVRKLIWTTALSVIIFAVSLWAYIAGYFNVEWLTKMMGFPI